jgi:hypothetical protein
MIDAAGKRERERTKKAKKAQIDRGKSEESCRIKSRGQVALLDDDLL